MWAKNMLDAEVANIISSFSCNNHKTSKSSHKMASNIRDIREVFEDEANGLVFEKNVSIPLKASDLPIRCNVYRPIASADQKFPVLVTYGPYGKDIPYDKWAFQQNILYFFD